MREIKILYVNEIIVVLKYLGRIRKSGERIERRRVVVLRRRQYLSLA